MPADGMPAGGLATGGLATGRMATGRMATGDRELVGIAPASCPAMPPGFDSLVITPDRSLFLRPPTDLAADMRQE
jgi:hypothetical protein